MTLPVLSLIVWSPFVGALLVMLIYPGQHPLSIRGLGAQALHLTNYWVILHGDTTLPVGTHVYWSLAVEEHFYLMFPLLYLLMRRSRLSARDQALALWSLCGLVLLWRCVLVYGEHVGAERTFLGTDTRIDAILFGCALAVWKNPVLDGVSDNERLWKWSVVPAALLALGLCFIERADAFRETFRYSVQGIALTVIFIAAIRYEKWIVFRWLNTKPMIFLGTLSYSLYLIHDAALVNIARLNPGLARLVIAALALALSVGVAWLLYVTVEKPCARARKRLLMRARKPPAPEAPPRTVSAERPSSRRPAGSANTRWA